MLTVLGISAPFLSPISPKPSLIRETRQTNSPTKSRRRLIYLAPLFSFEHCIVPFSVSTQIFTSTITVYNGIHSRLSVFVLHSQFLSFASFQEKHGNRFRQAISYHLQIPCRFDPFKEDPEMFHRQFHFLRQRQLLRRNPD